MSILEFVTLQNFFDSFHQKDILFDLHENQHHSLMLPLPCHYCRKKVMKFLSHSFLTFSLNKRHNLLGRVGHFQGVPKEWRWQFRRRARRREEKVDPKCQHLPRCQLSLFRLSAATP